MKRMSAGRQRRLQRIMHLVAGVALLAYVYAPIGSELEATVRVIVAPLLAVSGLAMWQAPRVRRALRRRRPAAPAP
jgi:hypothetical protein